MLLDRLETPKASLVILHQDGYTQHVFEHLKHAHKILEVFHALQNTKIKELLHQRQEHDKKQKEDDSKFV